MCKLLHCCATLGVGMFYLAMAMAIITRVLQFPLDHISKRTMLIDVATSLLFVESHLNTSLNAWLDKIVAVFCKDEAMVAVEYFRLKEN